MEKLLRDLCGLDGPSGCEDSVRDYIQAAAAPYAERMLQDAMGNLMVFVKGKTTPKKTIMVCAHMDEVGVIVKRITEDGMLKFGFVGGVDPRVAIGRRVRFGDVRGVIGIKAVHLTTPEERKTMPRADELYIDIGACSKEEAEIRVSPGRYGTFDSDCAAFGDGLWKAKAIDDRLGCAVLLQLMAAGPPVDCWFVFTVQEETGLRGAQTAAFRLQPDIALIVEGTTAADIFDVPAHKQVCRLREGAVIPFMDRGTIYDRELFDCLRNIACRHSIKWQTKHAVAGGTDAGRIHLSRAGVRTCGLAVPVRYIHSPVSVAALCDMEGVLALAKLFLEEMKEHG